jgi:DNA-binding response OmpR family regulator
MQPAQNFESLTILSISPLEEDHISLQSIVRRSTWVLLKADSIVSARDILEQHDVSVVLCEQDLMPGRWTDVLHAINDLPQPPSLIVSSRLADERVWAEALNLGAWDVLAKPFEQREVVRSVKSAWQRWYNQVRTPARTMRAASSVAE